MTRGTEFASDDGVELLQYLGTEHYGVITRGTGQALQGALTPDGVAGVDGVHEHVGVEETDHAPPPPVALSLSVFAGWKPAEDSHENKCST